MNWKSTLVLVVLAGVAGLWLWKGDEWGPEIGLIPTHTEPPPSEAIRTVDAFTPAAITRIEIAFPSGDPLVLDRADANAEWRLPGNWPLRKPEVEELVQTLGTLRTRFYAIPLSEGADLSAYGLAPGQNPLPVMLTINSQQHVLLFGDPKPAGDETAFTRPAFVRIDNLPEVLQLGPDVMPVLRRSAESYRRRALFPDVERVKVSAGSPGSPGGDTPSTLTLPGEETERISVSRPTPQFLGIRLLPMECDFTLIRRGKLPEPAVMTRGGEPAINSDRLADAWELELPIHSRDGFPYRDNCEPGRLRSVLTAVADLWVEQFASPAEARFALDSRYALAQLIPLPLEPPLAQAVRLYPGAAVLDPIRQKVPIEERTGLARTERAVSVKRKGGSPLTVRFGGLTVIEREQSVTVLGDMPGSPPQTKTVKVPVEYRYARVDGNPLVFTVAAEKLPDLFATVGELVDRRVARFSSEEVQEVVIRSAGRPEVKLTRTKGNPNADKPEDRADRWFLDARPNPLLADTGRVNELLRRLTRFRAADFDRLRYPERVPAAQMQISIVAREPRPEGEPDAPARQFTLLIDNPDPVKELLPVSVAGAQRVTLVDNRLGNDTPNSWLGAWLFPNTVSDLLERPSIAYRGRKLFDTANRSLIAINVVGGFSLKKDGEAWKLTAPLSSEADPGKAAQLASTLSGLSATEFLTETPTASELTAFGLDKPAQAVTLAFTGGRTYTLELGSPRPGKPEVFARLDQGGVFGLPSAVTEQLATGAVGLLPLNVWSTQPDKITALEITRHGGGDSFTLTRDGTNWKLTGPFTAPVQLPNAQPMLTTLGKLTAVRYQSLSPANRGRVRAGQAALDGQAHLPHQEARRQRGTGNQVGGDRRPGPGRRPLRLGRRAGVRRAGDVPRRGADVAAGATRPLAVVPRCQPHCEGACGAGEAGGRLHAREGRHGEVGRRGH